MLLNKQESQNYIINTIQMKSKKQKQRQNKDKILNSIPIFLAKTYRIVDNPEYADTIQWIPEQNGFIVKNITDLTEKIFPKHFKHTNYASFVRQLNLYGFHKVRSNQDGHIFTHQYFQKNNPDLLPLIKRKNANGGQLQKLQKSSELVLRHNPSNLLNMGNPEQNKDAQLQKQLGSLTQKHENLQNLVSMLVDQNKQIIMQNKAFINKINSLDDSYRKKLETLIFLMVFGLKNGDNNIIVPQQLNHMIKAFATSKKDKKPKQNNGNQSNSSQAVQLFKKPAPDQSRFNNKNIEQILQMLKMQSEGGGDGSDNQQGKHDQIQDVSGHSPSIQNARSNVSQSKYQNHQQLLVPQSIPLSPISSLRSIPSRFNGTHDDFHDFLEKLQHSQLEQDHKQ